MNSKANFYRYCQQYRVTFTQASQPGGLQQAAIDINSACGFAKSFCIIDFPVSPVPLTDQKSLPRDLILDRLYQLEMFMSIVYSENIFEIEPHLKQQTVAIDEDWKTKATTYISRIRDVIRMADLNTIMHDAVMNKLDDLQRQIDVKQVPLESLANVIFTLTEAVGKGAKNLDPAVKLFERLMGAFYGLRRSQTGEEPKQLPAPETLGLPDYTDGEGSTSASE